MSDPLASFFAKKDKKKTAKKEQSVSEDKISKEPKANVVFSRRVLGNDDGEWGEFEEDREKDYTNLKIQSLTIKDREEEYREQKLAREKQERQQNEDALTWKKSEVVASVVEKPKPEPEKDIKPKKYIPPSLRSAPLVSRKKGLPPEIKSVNEFPTL